MPDYGTTNGLAQGDTVACAASGPATAGGTLYTVAGHVLETLSGATWVNPVTNTATSLTYTPGTAAGRLTWLWEPVAYRLVAAPEGGSETITFSCQPDMASHYTAGTQVTLTANAATQPPASTFVRWHGDVPAGQETANPLTVTMDRPRTITPEFRRDWVYTPGKPATINNGDWWLTVSGTATLTISGVATNGASGLLDLTPPISNSGVITAIGGFSGNTALKELRLPDTVTTLAGQAFRYCSALTNVVPFLPESVTSVGYYTFESTGVAGDLYLANTASCAYSEGAFSRCPGIRRVYFGPANTAFGSRMFEAVATQKEIFWNCDFPTSIGWGPLAGVNAGLVRFYAPLGNASWEEFMATGAGFSAMTAAETNAYLAAYPGDPLPVGMWKPRESARQYLLTWNPLAGQNTLTIDGVPQQIGAAEPARSTRLPPRRLSSSLRARRSAS